MITRIPYRVIDEGNRGGLGNMPEEKMPYYRTIVKLLEWNFLDNNEDSGFCKYNSWTITWDTKGTRAIKYTATDGNNIIVFSPSHDLYKFREYNDYLYENFFPEMLYKLDNV